jgi:transcriptional regulator with XRE-family HTH domain
MSQKDLAGRTGFDQSYISLIETGTRTPSVAALENIAKVLNIPIYLLLLLASEENDLRGITPDHAAALGAHLLRILTELKDG